MGMLNYYNALCFVKLVLLYGNRLSKLIIQTVLVKARSIQLLKRALGLMTSSISADGPTSQQGP